MTFGGAKGEPSGNQYSLGPVEEDTPKKCKPEKMQTCVACLAFNLPLEQERRAGVMGKHRAVLPRRGELVPMGRFDKLVLAQAT